MATTPIARRALPSRSSWASHTCEYLVRRVICRQHTEIERWLPVLEDLAHAAADSTGQDRGDLHAIEAELAALRADLADHFQEEEQVLMSLLDIELAYAGHRPMGRPRSNREALDQMAEKHRQHEFQLDRLRNDAIRLAASRDALAGERRLSDQLLDLDRMLLDHFHLEEDVLLPRIARMEAELAG